ncbi:hypothetical protein EYR41_008025 [Orbilia oligospora]|uniref:Uncharacterized protein n=1 Tax=Orbilia oligospora TaxID=2813651 RepID=A0A8H2HGY5_ORBOL|nr:hypothetical protein TWF217_003041 [Orbilia oligospora]TGJ66389.1 hypothetical protein EYR41_008025 [Orbilia oligospora]
MSSLSSTIRSVMWNIYIHTFKQTIIKPTKADAIAGFTCSNGLNISTGTIFEDLKIIYPSLHDYSSLTLWEVRDDGSVEFINPADEDREFEFKTSTNNLRLCLGLIVHDTNHVLCQGLISRGAGITEHFHAGCAKVPILKFDPEKNGYLPNEPSYHISPTWRSHTPSEDSASRPATPGSDELRQREEQESREFARNNFDIDPKSFERSVKYAYTECLITRTNSRCGPLLCGPGYATTHLVPPALWFSYPDERPVEDFLSYDDEFVPNYPEERDRVALAHHYTQCVIENVGANSIGRYQLQSSQVLGVWKRQVDAILQSAWGGDYTGKDNYIQEESLIKEHIRNWFVD